MKCYGLGHLVSMETPWFIKPWNEDVNKAMTAAFTCRRLTCFSEIYHSTLATDDCRALQFKLPVNNRKLVGHVIKSVLVKSEIGCEAKCFKEDNCMSMNLGPLEDGKHVCELSSSDHDLHPEDLKHQEEFIYRPVLNHCSSSPCPPTYRCQTGFTA
ncbi:uncharacterized protein LOC144656430 [Oculina patagonica]